MLETTRAYYVGHLGKYVPGKALVVIIRTGLISGPRVDTTVAAVSIFIETLTMMAVGAFLAADRSAATMTERLAEGVPLDAGTWESLCETGRGLGVDPPTTQTPA